MQDDTEVNGSCDEIEDEGEDDLLNTSYDPTNSFNIFEHEMKIKGNGLQINNQV